MAPKRNLFNGRISSALDYDDQKQQDSAVYSTSNSYQDHFVHQQQPSNLSSVVYMPVEMSMKIPPQGMMPSFVATPQRNLPLIPPSNQVSVPRRSIADFESCMMVRRKDQRIKQLEDSIEQMKREKEESSKYSIKRISIASDSEADEFPPLASSTDKRKKRKKNHRHRSHKSKKGHKRSRRHRKSSSSSSSSSSNSSRSRSSSVEILESRGNISEDVKAENIFDAKNNPWRLLRSVEYGYRTTHLVMDTSGDSNNLKYDRSFKSDIAKHNSLDGALSNIFGAIRFNVAAFPTENARYFHLLCRSNGQSSRVERIFRHKRPVGIIDVEPVRISSDRYVPNDDDQKIVSHIANMTLDAYEDYKKSKFLSWEEADLEEKRILLSTRIVLEPSDVDAWIRFIRLQDELIAFEESGDAGAVVRNKRALYLKKQSILGEAMKFNRSNIALRLEWLDVGEAYLGSNSQELSDMERRLIKEFPCNLEMWEALLQRCQNNCAKFAKNKMVYMIDNMCLSNMLGARGNDPNNDAAIDEFLVSLLVHRCKLLIECGFADQAVASLQALTEFHLFPMTNQPVVDDMNVKRFETFWVNGVPRIGDEGAVGWCRSETNELASANECTSLEKECSLAARKEKLIFDECCRKASSTAEIWTQLETFRDQTSWVPVRSPTISPELFKFPSRRVSFEEVRPLLFAFSRRTYAEDLVFKILQLFGTVIPGMKNHSQEEILHRFSPDLFPRSSIRYEGMFQFLDRFLLLLSSAMGVDVVRILSSREMTFVRFELAGSDMDARAREKALIVRKRNLDGLVGLSEAENVAVTFHMLKSSERLSGEWGSRKFIKFLSIPFSLLSSSIWSIQSERDRLIYLKMAKALCRRLPSVVDVSPDPLQTKKIFLMGLGANGNTKELPNESLHKDRAWKSWVGCLKTSSVSRLSEFNWLGNEAEVILELAATFFFEVADGGRVKKWKVFDEAMTKSPLAKSMENRPIVQKLRCKFYISEMNKTKLFSPKVLIHMLKDAMSRFPESIYFAKNFVEASSVIDGVVFLKRNPGTGYLSRRIRSNALILLCLKECARSGHREAHFIKEVIEAATKVEPNLILPDAYFWCWMLSLEMVNKSAKKVREVFELGRKHCPWSKRFLVESAKNCGLFDELLTGLADIFDESGLQMYWDPSEISRQLAL